jgi:hypothetical protein
MAISGYRLDAGSLPLNCIIDLLAMYAHVPWRVDSDPDLVSTDIKNRNPKLIAHNNRLILLPA